MSAFGGPGGRVQIQKPTPPERGSFPLDHDGECKSVMTTYLRCLRQHRGTNDPECRALSKQYLQCRMEHNLMAPDEMRNLGFAEEDDGGAKAAARGGGLADRELKDGQDGVSGGAKR
ncbi:Cytochrome c oxidase assembly protein cox19 [Coniosporium apollinis]|uniref:Cytochrome c oxidase assembly protein cox19 n=2 Tax=Coniosporium TaxID=2810619 RepID=A0ABQ9P245_9PEZI|nr:Cytochrome c oxidase assembly protein cox19 [Cladosporium sp. JES 115]KAJ9668685.1 Cytochrome c oxidase assembly protein cox19 [Coniosporium apollinis]